jgi:hypothetical protein
MNALTRPEEGSTARLPVLTRQLKRSRANNSEQIINSDKEIKHQIIDLSNDSAHNEGEYVCESKPIARSFSRTSPKLRNLPSRVNASLESVGCSSNLLMKSPEEFRLNDELLFKVATQSLLLHNSIYHLQRLLQGHNSPKNDNNNQNNNNNDNITTQQQATFRWTDAKSACKASHCALLRQSDYSALSLETKEQLFKASKSTTNGRAVNQAKQLLDSGQCNPSVAVYEIINVAHPARFFSVPSKKSFALVAIEKLQAGEALGSYTGKFHEHKYTINSLSDAVISQQSYAMEIDSATIWGNYLGPNLIVEAKTIGGNELRFTNDCNFRHAGKRTENCIPQVCWHSSGPENRSDSFPAVVFTAKRTIESGEEIVLDYGEAYWCGLRSELCLEHTHYQRAALKFIQQLEALCCANNISVPNLMSANNNNSNGLLKSVDYPQNFFLQ